MAHGPGIWIIPASFDRGSRETAERSSAEISCPFSARTLLQLMQQNVESADELPKSVVLLREATEFVSQECC
jgi:hypothetical protein